MLNRVCGTALLAVLLVGFSGSPAQAAPITVLPNTSTSFQVLWSHLVEGTELRALGNFSLNVTDTHVEFLVTMTNQTALWNERVHSIGFNTNPNATSLTNTVAGNYFGNFGLNTTFPGFQRIDVCAWASENCAGGAQTNNLPGLGTTDTFGFRLNGNFSEGITLERFAIQFMGNLGSFQVEGTTHRVPEPATLLMLALGLVGTAATRRRWVA